MTAMFDEVRADLSGMINSREKIYIDNIMHKAFIEINEEYTEATAVSREFKKYLFGVIFFFS